MRASPYTTLEPQTWAIKNKYHAQPQRQRRVLDGTFSPLSAELQNPPIDNDSPHTCNHTEEARPLPRQARMILRIKYVQHTSMSTSRNNEIPHQINNTRPRNCHAYTLGHYCPSPLRPLPIQVQRHGRNIFPIPRLEKGPSVGRRSLRAQARGK